MGCLTKHCNRNVSDPRTLARILNDAEAHLEMFRHPDPVIREYMEFITVDAELAELGNSTDCARWYKMVSFYVTINSKIYGTYSIL